MRKNLRLLLTALLCAVMGQAMAQEVKLDFSDNTNWNFPTSSTSGTGEHTSNGYTISIYASNGYYFFNNKCLFLGKTNSTLTLPEFDFDVEKIVVLGNSGASGKVTENIYVGETPVSEEATGSINNNTFEILSNYQAAGNIYILKITNNNNAQITGIEIYKKGSGGNVKLTPNLSFGNTKSYTVVEGDDFEPPTLTYAEGFNGTVTYSSNNEDVATVDEDGNVDIVSAGKAIITATSVETNAFQAGEASYTIYVVAASTHVIEDKIFDFTDFTDYGTGLTPNNKNGAEDYIYDDYTWTAGNVTLVSSGKYRWWLASTETEAGVVPANTLRLYNNVVDDKQTTKLTISAPSGKKITKIEFEGSSLNDAFTTSTGEFASGNWTGEAQSVVLTYAGTGTKQIKKITVTYTTGTTPPNPDLPVCENIAAFKALESDTEAELKLVNAEVLYAKGRDVYVHDESGAIEFYNLGLNLENNQVLNGSVIGKFSPYHNLPEIVKTDNTNANNLNIVEASDAEPLELTLAQAQDMQYVCELVSFESVNIEEADGSFSLSDGQSTLALYNKFSIGLSAASNIKVAGILVIYDDTYQLYPITVDYGELPDPELAWSVETLEVVIGDDFTQPTLSAAEGFDLSTVTYKSSNASVAKMEEGALVIVGPGTAVITAKADVSSTFAAGSAEFTVIVTRPTPVASGKYMLVTDVATLADGDEVIIVGANTPKVNEGEEPVTNYYALGTNQKNNNREAVSVTMNADGTITGNTDVQVITLEEKWYLNVGNGYLYAAGSGKNNYLRTEEEKDEDNNAKANITIADGVTNITFQGTNTNCDIRFNYNNGTPLFACYAPTSTQANVYIYRKMVDSILLGDANGDGEVSLSDIMLVVDAILTDDTSHLNLTNADIDKSGGLSLSDIMGIVAIILAQ